MRWVYLSGGWEVEVWLVGQVGSVVLWSSLSCGAVFVFVKLRPGASLTVVGVTRVAVYALD